MALSFGDSVGKIKNSTLETTAAIAEVFSDIREENFTKSDKYEWYDNYHDENFSIINQDKSISVDSSQINLTQETNSQFIPFELPRYYDGIDLMEMSFRIHYVNADKNEYYSTPINVTYSDTSIRFGWLVDNYATAIEGLLQFEITANGVNEKGDNYIWKSRPDGKINILKSLTGNAPIKPDEDWYTQFITMIDSKVAEARQEALSAKASADKAIEASDAAQNVVDNAKQEILDQVSGSLEQQLSTALEQYYDKEEVNALIKNIDLTEALKDINNKIDNIDGLAKFKVEYNENTKTISFYNGEVLIKSVTIDTSPSSEWVTSYNGIVDAKIQKGIEPVTQELQQFKTSTQKDLEGIHSEVDGLPEKLNTDFYKKPEINTLLEQKAPLASVEEIRNKVGVMESSVKQVEENITQLGNDFTELEEVVNKINQKPSNEYEATYEDNVFTLLENGQVKNQFTITGGSGGGDSTTITIERITPDNVVTLLGSITKIEFNFKSVDNTGDTTGNGTATWKVGNTIVATSVTAQGNNSFDITEYLKTGTNNIRLSITDSFGTVSAKTWTVTVVEFKIESNFDDTLFYTGETTFRYTPYGNVSKQIIFKLDGTQIGTVGTPVTGRQMTQTIPAQSHGAHLLEVYMTAEIGGHQVRSNSVFKDIIWVSPSNTTPIIGCSIKNFEVKQYNTYNIKYVVYDPENIPANITLHEDANQISALKVDRTGQIWNYKSATFGEKTLTIKCRNISKTIVATVTDLGIEIKPITTNLAFDFNPSGKNNGDEDRLWEDKEHNLHMSVSDNFDWSNGGYQLDEDGDTYFCVKAGTTAAINYKLFGDDAKKTGKNFKFVYKCTNVRDYEGQVLSCKNGNIGFKVNAQSSVLSSEQNTMSLPFCEDNYMELEFNILPDSEYKEMVMWLDGIPSKVELYSSSDSFTQTEPQNILIGSEDCDVWVYRMKAYTMNLTDDEILDNHIADAKNAEEIMSRYARNNILDSSGNLDPDLLAERCPDLRIIKIESERFTTGKKDKVTAISFQQIYKNGRPVDNWTSEAGVFSGQGTSSEYYGESARNLDINCKNGFNFEDGSSNGKYAMTENSIPVNYFNIKVNVASSENINNSTMAQEYHRFNPYIRQARKDNPKVRDTMEFHPCVVFIKETDTSNAVEFKDGQWHFYACGNIGNSKKNDEAFGMNPENHKEFIVEVSNNTDPQCRFLSDDLSNEGWDGDTSFEMRYENPNCTEEELQAGKDAWQTFLTWVVNVTPENFVKEFDQHCIRDSVLFYYLFTERHTLVDNRAKNTFWHTEDLVHWDLCFDYDNDTAMGNDNEGGLTLTYGYEDTDTIGTKSVFNAADSKIYCYVRDYFKNELDQMFITLESKLAWSANRILEEMEKEQALKPERLWIMDMRRKYFRPYEDNGTVSYLPMMHGDKKHQRRQFQKYQEKYMSSKHVGTACTSDVITIRGYTPTEWSGVKPDGTFHIIPYADTYIVNRFGSNLTKVRAKRGQKYEIKSPIEAMNDTEVYTYNASLIQSIGDIAPFYPGYTDFNQGIKLTDLTVGSGISGYKNLNMTDFGIGRNILLERLNLQNLPNLRKTISLENCTNLTEFLAEGSGITGVIFATGGKISTAHLPAIASLTAKNLTFLTDFSIESYENITTLSIEDCSSIPSMDIINKSPNLNRLRLTGINWNLENDDLLKRLSTFTGIDENGYNTEHSVLSGSVHVPVMREQQLAKYESIWKNLDITYDTLIVQYTVTFVNYDETVLDIQYIDKGATPVDPVTRPDSPIAKPTKPSSVSTDYAYSGWDTKLAPVFSDIKITATYSESLRRYTVKYMSRGNILQTQTAEYGSSVYYTGDIPTYTAEESAYKYYLFTGWDKSPFVNGDKEINAVYDSCEYNVGYFDGKPLSTLRPVEIYAMTKVGVETDKVKLKDSFSFNLGHDYSYSDIQEQVIINEKKVFNGNEYYDSGITLFDKDRDFILAIDYKFETTTPQGSIIAQCFQNDGVQGFRIWNNNAPKFSWGTSSTAVSGLGKREMVIVRHIKGENGVHVYSANLSGDKPIYVELTKTRDTQTNATLVFGSGKADDGSFENHAVGTVYWSKIWFADLGDKICKELSSWTHEAIDMEMCGFKRYYLSDGSNKRTSMSFLAKHLLSVDKAIGVGSSNEGGWATTSLNTFLNTRLYEAFPVEYRQLLKQVRISSSIGNQSNDISTSDCYIHIPSAYEVDPTMTSEPYIYEGTPITYLTTNESRICSYDGGNSHPYWLRSPNISYSTYYYRVENTGTLSGYYYPYNEDGIRIMFSV